MSAIGVRARDVLATWRAHLPEYAAEALGLGLFMVSASAFATLLEHPASPARHALPDATVRRVLMGVAMGSTAVALIHSPWGRRSGAHLNPSVTFAFWRLGRVRAADLAGYAAGQFAGATLAMSAMNALMGAALADPAVHWVVTRPGPAGSFVAAIGESLVAFVTLSTVLHLSDAPRASRWTGAAAGTLVALWISIEAPISGMSMNPARTFGSAFAAHDWTAWWVYVVAPPLGMLAATELYLVLRHRRADAPHGCAKLDHAPNVPCIFCGQGLATSRDSSGTSAAPASLSAVRQP